MVETTFQGTPDILDRPNAESDTQQQWEPNPKLKWQFEIDIVGSCNLTCPTCPNGNLAEFRTNTKYMRPEMLDQIVRKAVSECRVDSIYLYNWTEPFLHPDLPEMIRIVRSHGVPCGLSSNLNIIKNLDAVMAANPDFFKVSLSGFTQEKYGITHRRGDIEVVKRNMAEVAKAKERAGGTTRLAVAFHRYLGNHEEEYAMRDYAESLGYVFEPAWAYLMPLEKMMAYVGNNELGVALNEQDRRMIDLLALPLQDAVEASKKTVVDDCTIRSRQMIITSAGDAMLCSTTFDQDKYKLGPYLDLSLKELQEKRYNHPACGPCMKNGMHVLFGYECKEFDDLALANIAGHYPEAKLERMKPLDTTPRPQGIHVLPYKAKRELRRLLGQLGFDSEANIRDLPFKFKREYLRLLRQFGMKS